MRPLPRFEAAPCPVDEVPALAEADARCGFLVVPEKPGGRDGLLLRLAVAILPARSRTPAPDPVLYLHGGPGGHALEAADRWLDSPLREDRELILLDQRGTGFSEPALCPDLSEQDARVAAGRHAPGAEIAARKAVSLRCRDALLEAGIDLGAWNSTTSAQDVEGLRVALGIEQWNLLGVSYGTRLALAVMRAVEPATLRSVILDSAYPPWAPGWDTRTPDFARALGAFFEACLRDEGCRRLHPGLEEDFRAALASFERDPVVTKLAESAGPGWPDTRFIVDPQDFAIIVHQFLYDTRAYGGLPAVIEKLSLRDPKAWRNVTEIAALRATSLSRAVALAVECYDRASFQSREGQARHGAVDPLIQHVHTYFDAEYDICPEWSPHRATPRELRPVRVDVPTLILAGRFDPITPPAWGERVSRTLPHASFLEFPVGHGAYRSHACPRSVVAAFVHDPSAGPDARCVAGMSDPEFVTRFRHSPDAWRLLSSLVVAPDPGVAGGLGAALVALLLGLVVPAGRNLARRFGGGAPVEASPSPSHGLVHATAGLALLFWAGLLGVLQWTASSETLLLMVGLPYGSHVLFWIPVVGLALALAAGIALWRGWSALSWSARGTQIWILAAAVVLLGIRFAFEL